MRLRRTAGVLVGLAALVWLCSMPVAAQSVNRELIDDLNTQLLYVALPLTVFVEVILIYAVIRFRNNENPKPTVEAPPLEITWTLATAIILLFVGVSAYVVLTSPFISPGASATADVQENETVHVLGYQWGWQFTYPEENVTTQGELVIPANESVKLQLTSAAVLHAMFVPELGIKKDVFPGEHTTARTVVYEKGTYRLYCTELCGVGHSRMQANVTVVNGSVYRTWLEENRNSTNVTEVPSPD